MSAFTPGPWRIEADTTLIWGNCNPDDKTSYGMGYPVASCEHTRPWRRESPTDAEIDANANLIAAAPDLLAALHSLQKEVTLLLNSGRLSVDDASHAARIEAAEFAARAAIAKARGETK